ncbi:MAG TPA: DUF973 family protein [Candidatus Acidoferrum sp.]|nr:DUF973 family protein [Candidatus Acidoferrum sp.]
MADLNMGIGKLRTAMLIYLIGALLGVVGSFSGLSPALSGASLGATPSPSALVPYLAILVVGGIIALVALITMRSGFKMMASSNNTYGIGATGTLLQLIGIIFVVIAVILLIVTYLSASSASSVGGAALTVLGGSAASLGLIGLGGLLGFIGAILVLIGFWRIGSSFNNTLIKVGAIFFILFSLLGVILLYLGLRDIGRGSKGPAAM